MIHENRFSPERRRNHGKVSGTYNWIKQNTSAKERSERSWAGMYEAGYDCVSGKSDLPEKEGIGCDIRLCILSSSSLNTSVSWKKKKIDRGKAVISALNSWVLLKPLKGFPAGRKAIGGKPGLTSINQLSGVGLQSWFSSWLNSWVSKWMSSSECFTTL